MTGIVDGVHLLSLPTPFPVGNVNCYLIEGKPATLIDAGPHIKQSVDLLEKSLSHLDYSLADIDQVLLTHGHVDHAGNVKMIRDSGEGDDSNSPNVWIHEMDSERVTDYKGYTESRIQAYLDIMELSGVPEELKSGFSANQLIKFFGAFGESVQTVDFLTDNMLIETGIGDLQAIWTPGHSLGSVCFVNNEHSLIFTGDHVLGSISSNPSLDFEGKLGISMQRHLNSLEKVEVFGNYRTLPGHRDPLFNLSLRIQELKEEYSLKIKQAQTIIDKSPKTIYQISREIFGDYPQNSLILALAESYDLVRILEQEGQVYTDSRSGAVYAKKT